MWKQMAQTIIGHCQAHFLQRWPTWWYQVVSKRKYGQENLETVLSFGLDSLELRKVFITTPLRLPSVWLATCLRPHSKSSCKPGTVEYMGLCHYYKRNLWAPPFSQSLSTPMRSSAVGSRLALPYRVTQSPNHHTPLSWPVAPLVVY